MAADLKVDTLTAAPGEKKAGFLKMTAAGRVLDVPCFVINGKSDGPTLVVTGGIHGAEYASIEAALQLGRSVTPEKLHGRVIVVPVVNVTAFFARSIYVCPLDGKNLNRFQPGKAVGTATDQINYWLFENVIKQADYYMDMHGGDLIEALVPFSIYHMSGNATLDAKSKELAEVFGIHYIVSSDSQGSTYSAASEMGIPGMLAESGGQGIWPPEAVALLTNGMNRVMRHLGMLEGSKPEPMPTKVLKEFPWVRSEHDGFLYLDVKVGDKVEKGQVLGKVTDFEGNVLQTAVAPASGEVLFTVSSLAINNGDPLLAVGA